MARAGAAVVLAFAVCCLLVTPGPARRPLDLPAQLPDAVDREAAAEPLLPKLLEVADAEEANQATAIAVPEQEEEPHGQRSSSLLCLVFRCGAEPADAGGVAVARGSSDSWENTAAEEQGPYDSDSDCDSDSDDEDEGGILGWFWRLVDHGF